MCNTTAVKPRIHYAQDEDFIVKGEYYHRANSKGDVENFRTYVEKQLE